MHTISSRLNHVKQYPAHYWPEVLAIMVVGMAFYTLLQPWIRVIPPDDWAFRLPTVLLNIKTTFTLYDLQQPYGVVVALCIVLLISLWNLKWSFLPALAAVALAYYSLWQTEQEAGGGGRWQEKGFETTFDIGLWLFLAMMVLVIVLSALRWWIPAPPMASASDNQIPNQL